MAIIPLNSPKYVAIWWALPLLDAVRPSPLSLARSTPKSSKLTPRPDTDPLDIWLPQSSITHCLTLTSSKLIFFDPSTTTTTAPLPVRSVRICLANTIPPLAALAVLPSTKKGEAAREITIKPNACGSMAKPPAPLSALPQSLVTPPRIPLSQNRTKNRKEIIKVIGEEGEVGCRDCFWERSSRM